MLVLIVNKKVVTLCFTIFKRVDKICKYCVFMSTCLQKYLKYLRKNEVWEKRSKIKQTLLYDVQSYEEHDFKKNIIKKN